MAGLNKDRLIQLLLNENLCIGKTGGDLEQCVGAAFEKFVLKSFGFAQTNRRPFTPEVWTHVARGPVVPDGVFEPLALASLTGGATFADSGFLEVKAVQPGTVDVSEFKYQLLTMVDVLAGSPAVKKGAAGHLVLVTTAGVKVSQDMLIEATVSKVALWHAQVEEIDGANRDNLVVGPGHLLNATHLHKAHPNLYRGASVIPARPRGGLT